MSTQTQLGSGAAAAGPERLMQFTFGFAPPLMIEAAVRLGIFDAVHEGAATIAAVSAKTGASPRGVEALMNGLIGLDFLRSNGAGHYTLSPESANFLVRSQPAFLGDFFCLTSTHLLPLWLGLTQAVRSGKPNTAVDQERTGVPFFQELVKGIFPLSRAAAMELAQALASEAASDPYRILDLGAGTGVWSICVCQRIPSAQVTVVDWSGVIPVARETVERFGLSQRFTFVEGDLLEADFGRSHQLAILGHILHSEGRARSEALLHRAYEALAPGGQIAIAEWLVEDDRRSPPHSLIFAVNMLVATTQGSTFSFNEITQWLEAAGFRDARLLPVAGPSPLIVARKPAQRL